MEELPGVWGADCENLQAPLTCSASLSDRIMRVIVGDPDSRPHILAHDPRMASANYQNLAG